MIPSLGPLLLIAATLAQTDEAPLSLADLEAYRVALARQPDASAPLVRFRDLWDRPEAFAGRPVMVEGRLARIFRQPRLGEFPPLVEAWVVSEVGDPFCVVFADENGNHSPEIGTSVRFSGTFLRRIKYQGGDTARIVPLIVGPRPPSSLTPRTSFELWSWSSVDWIMGLGAAGVIALFLARRHYSRPVAPPVALEPHPVFIDGESEAEERNSDEVAH
jgi:hypothetical protein